MESILSLCCTMVLYLVSIKKFNLFLDNGMNILYTKTRSHF
ncbi:hypothetical protein HMPREF1246_2053 [Acidaminococcus sp. BV3L6]|nr:hypothetical protein HMPREF1246_2053 [Acidaminococcus sp. BV3L6]